jgi:hypothetical protein
MADGTLIITYDGDTERAFRLVGAFMHHWANIELALDRAVRNVLRLGAAEGLIATANLQFPGKIKVISTALAQSGPSWAKEGSEALKALSALHDDRMMVANDGFSGAPGSVVFYKVKANGSLKIPETTWSEADFEKKFDTLRDLLTKVTELVGRLEKGAPSLDPLVAIASTPAVKAAQASTPSRAPIAFSNSSKKKPARSRKAAASRKRRILEVKRPAASASRPAPKPTAKAAANPLELRPLPVQHAATASAPDFNGRREP